MKKIFCLSLVCAGMNFNALGGLYTISGGLQNGTVIPDGNMNGLANSVNVSSVPPTINSVSVTVTLNTPYIGDLYAYISHNGTTAILLNRVGVGTINGGDAFGNATSGSGMTITFSTGGSDIHWVTTPTSGGTYGADGRNISPLSSPSAFDATGTQGLTQFNGSDPNGTWTLFFVDAVSGGGDSGVVSWTLNIDAVPEPVNVALAVFGVCVVGTGVVRRIKAGGKKAPLPGINDQQ